MRFCEKCIDAFSLLFAHNPDGTEDTTFSANAGPGLNSYVYGLAVQSDGKLLVGGTFTSYAGNAAAPDRILRLNNDGTEDTAFSAIAGVGANAGGTISGFGVQNDGKINVVGSFLNYGNHYFNYFCELYPDGTFYR